MLPDNAIYFDNASTTPVHPEVRKLVNSLLKRRSPTANLCMTKEWKYPG